MPWVDGKWTWDTSNPWVIRSERAAKKAQEDLKKTEKELEQSTAKLSEGRPLDPADVEKINRPLEELSKDQYLKDLIEDEKLNRQLQAEKQRKEERERMANDKNYRKQVRKEKGFLGLFKRKRDPIEEFDRAEGFGSGEDRGDR